MSELSIWVMATVLPCSSGNASDSGTEKPWTSWPCLSAGRVDGRNIHRRKRELRSTGKDTAEPRIRPTLQKDASLSRAFGAISTSPWGHLVRTEGVSPTTATALLLGGNCHQCRRAAFSGRSLSLHRGEAAGGLGAPKEVPPSGGGGRLWVEVVCDHARERASGADTLRSVPAHTPGDNMWPP